MKNFQECPRCGPKYTLFGNYIYQVYRCDDCEITFCSKCSKGSISTYEVGVHEICPNHVDYTKLHNTRNVGEYMSKRSELEKKTAPKNILELRKKYGYRW